MKKLFSIVAVASVLTACGTTGSNDAYYKRAQMETERQDRAAEQAISKAPEWMFKLPKSPSAVYENGTAISSDFAMADMKAKTIAYAKICTAAGGKVRSQTKVYRQDSDSSSTEASEMAIRNICPDIDITGVETVDMKHVAEAGRIRTYVLVALPIGNANTLRKEADAREDRKAAKARVPDAFKELDAVTKGQPIPEVQTDPKLPHDTISDQNVKSKVQAAIERGNAVIMTETVR